MPKRHVLGAENIGARSPDCIEVLNVVMCDEEVAARSLETGGGLGGLWGHVTHVTTLLNRRN